MQVRLLWSAALRSQGPGQLTCTQQPDACAQPAPAGMHDAAFASCACGAQRRHQAVACRSAGLGPSVCLQCRASCMGIVCASHLRAWGGQQCRESSASPCPMLQAFAQVALAHGLLAQLLSPLSSPTRMAWHMTRWRCPAAACRCSHPAARERSMYAHLPSGLVPLLPAAHAACTSLCCSMLKSAACTCQREHDRPRRLQADLSLTHACRCLSCPLRYTCGCRASWHTWQPRARRCWRCPSLPALQSTPASPPQSLQRGRASPRRRTQLPLPARLSQVCRRSRGQRSRQARDVCRRRSLPRARHSRQRSLKCPAALRRPAALTGAQL